MSPKRRQARHIGDLHFMDPKVAALRGYEDWAAHDKAVVRDWYSSVPDDDTVVYVYGDICKGNVASWEHALRVLAGLPGDKRLINGNHDRTHPMHSSWVDYLPEALAVFTSITPASAIRLGGRTVMQSHFPYAGDHIDDHTGDLGERYTQWRLRDEGKWLVHAHVHDAWTVQDRQISVSWEKWRNGFATDNNLIALIERGERIEADYAAMAAELAEERRQTVLDHGGGS